MEHIACRLRFVIVLLSCQVDCDKNDRQFWIFSFGVCRVVVHVFMVHQTIRSFPRTGGFPEHVGGGKVEDSDAEDDDDDDGEYFFDVEEV